MPNLIRKIGRAELEVMLDAVRRVESDPELFEQVGISAKKLSNIGRHLFNTFTENPAALYNNMPVQQGIWDLVHKNFTVLRDILRVAELSEVEFPEGRNALSVLLAQKRSEEQARSELRLDQKLKKFDVLTKRAYTIQSGAMWSRLWRPPIGMIYTLALGDAEMPGSHWLYLCLFPDAAQRCIQGVKLAIGRSREEAAIPSSNMFDIKVNGRRPQFTEFQYDEQLKANAIIHRAKINPLRSLYLSVGLIPRAHSMFIHPLKI